MNRIALSIVSLLAWPLLSTAAVKPVNAAHKKAVKRMERTTRRTTRADATRQGIKATLRYEQTADMPTPRMAHQVLPSGDGFVVMFQIFCFYH